MIIIHLLNQLHPLVRIDTNEDLASFHLLISIHGLKFFHLWQILSPRTEKNRPISRTIEWVGDFYGFGYRKYTHFNYIFLKNAKEELDQLPVLYELKYHMSQMAVVMQNLFDMVKMKPLTNEQPVEVGSTLIVCKLVEKSIMKIKMLFYKE